jgi:hypothetical protein
VVKNGWRERVQRYKCFSCGFRFQNKNRAKRFENKIWNEYVFKKQTLSELSHDYDYSIRSLQQKIKDHELIEPRKLEPKEIILVIDTTYFDGFGVMLFRCARHRENLLWYFIYENETVALYLTGIAELESQGYVILAIVFDGKSGLIQALTGRYLVQLCIFHQVKTVRRHITKYPRLEAGKELQQIMYQLKSVSKEIFIKLISDWHEQWKIFLAEQTISPINGRKHFVHKRLRAACRSVRKNFPYLFTWRDYPELEIPSTTNSLDGTFSHLKQKIHIHRGLSMETQKKAIEDILRFKKPEKSPQNFH